MDRRHSAVQLSESVTTNTLPPETINVGLDIQHSSLMTSYLSPNKFCRPKTVTSLLLPCEKWPDNFCQLINNIRMLNTFL